MDLADKALHTAEAAAASRDVSDWLIEYFSKHAISVYVKSDNVARMARRLADDPEEEGRDIRTVVTMITDLYVEAGHLAALEANFKRKTGMTFGEAVDVLTPIRHSLAAEREGRRA